MHYFITAGNTRNGVPIFAMGELTGELSVLHPEVDFETWPTKFNITLLLTDEFGTPPGYLTRTYWNISITVRTGVECRAGRVICAF